MDDQETFLEQPLDRELYKPKNFVSAHKQPLRVLVTDAGGKIAYNIIYEICSGKVFGPDQEIILHLINSRGSIHHKAIVLELEECGFPVYKDFVLSSNPAVAYRKVDVIIAVATFEEMPGQLITSTLVYQMIKTRQLAKYSQEYANKNVKIIFTGPSTKALTLLTAMFSRFAPKFPINHVSSLNYLDVVISKAVLAAKLKTTTDKIKNIVIWSATVADVHNATVRMYPPNDRGSLEMKDIPIIEALQDDAWLYSSFGLSVFRRVMTPDLIKFGKAVAQSTVAHLQILMNGSDNFEEISSMGVLTPPSRSYGIPPGFGFSFPVKTVNGTWTIIEDVKKDVPTHLNMVRTVFNLTHGVIINSMIKVVSFMLDYETVKTQMIQFSSKYIMDEVIETRHWTMKYFVTPNPAEGVANFRRDKVPGSSRKSIIWDDELSDTKKKASQLKSAIRFSVETTKEDRKESKSNSKKNSFFSYQTDDVTSILANRNSVNSNKRKDSNFSFI